eukprot:gb/GFBE01013938.1/.p1 GENE.gb/GFBE01013938.1/~~gb/GFBE01013938.1/.p1  ORF type:complete len:396 (+),score=60.60 gb/GFBE01013938.1/:1-1188(+)
MASYGEDASAPFLDSARRGGARASRSSARSSGSRARRRSEELRRRDPSFSMHSFARLAEEMPALRAATSLSHRRAALRVVSLDLPEDALRLVVDFAVSNILELLALALVDRQHHGMAWHRFVHELKWHGAAPPRDSVPSASCQLLVPQVAQQFVSLPELAFHGPGVSGEVQRDTLLDTFLPFAEEVHCPLLHCQGCSTPILKVEDVISSNYRIMTGRAYLTGAAYNVRVSEDMHEASYTTGVYRVRNVSCAVCELRLGITYVGAVDHQNQYKVGKYLVGQNCFVRPACCLLQGGRTADLPMPLCPRCQRTSERGALQLVNLMTAGLQVSRTRQLYNSLLRQEALESFTPSSGRMSAPRALLAWPQPRLAEVGGAGWSRVELLCRMSSLAWSPPAS